MALANALTAAAAAAQWQVVAQIAAELEAHRRARQAPEVIWDLALGEETGEESQDCVLGQDVQHVT